MFDEVTPIKSDCGALCGKACCRGEDSGMYLFPGEKKVFELLKPDWAEIGMSDFTYGEDKKRVPIIFCNGECDRYQRPLACRIFPLTPYLTKENELKIITDPRARAVCPMSRELKAEEYDRSFIKNVRNAFRLLIKHKKIHSFLYDYSRMLDEYLKFFKE